MLALYSSKKKDYLSKIQQKDLRKVLNDNWIILCTPEQIQYQQNFFSLIFNENMVDTVIWDEAHVIVSWGNTFRDSYLKAVETINVLGQQTTDVKVSAFTATITSSDSMEMKNLLNMSQPRIIISTHNFLNLNI